MENLSHSFSKKSYHGSSGFITTASKSLYDDVFGGPPKFGVPTLAPRYEDYTEIFGGFHSSRTSSIPILDLPLVDGQVSFDVESSHFDYSEIFGGFHVFDFALSYEDLVRQSTSASGYDSSDEAWSPAQSETLSDESDPSAFSERSQSSSGADVHYSSDGTRQFNISYHKTSQRNGGVVSNGTAHVTHLHAVPGYTYTVGGSQASRSTEDKEPSPREVETLDLDHNVDLGGAVLEDKRFKRSTSRNMSSSYIMNGTDLKLPEEFSEASCTPEKPFLTVSDISLRTRPSGLPPPSRPPPAKKGDFDRLNSRLKASKTSAFERKQGDNSQPYFDVEEYASSSAAASTAAIKDAMEKAQAKLRSAKELMERKKQDLKCYAKLHLEDSFLEERPSRTFDKDDKAQSTCVENMEEVFGSTEVISGNNEGKKTFKFTGKSEGSEQDKPNMSSQQPHKAEGRVAWREGAEYFEVVETYPPCRLPEKVKNESGLLRNMDLHEHRRFEVVTESLDSLETCKKVAANEAPDCKEESEEKVGQVSPQWGNKYQWSKEDDLCSQLEHQETVTAEENLFDFNVSEKNVKAEERFSTSDAEHIDIKLMEDCEIEDCEGGLRDVVNETRNGPRINECEQKDSQFRVDDLMKKENEGAETEGRANGACKGKDSDMKATEVLEQHENKTRALLASEVEFESRSEEASALEDSEQTSAFDGMLEELREQTDLETGFQSCKGEPEVGMPNLLPNNVCTREDTVDRGNDQIKRTDVIGSTASNGHSTNLSGAGTCTGKVPDRLKKEGSEMENHQKVMEERTANAKKIGDALAAVLEDLEILSSTGQRAAAVSAQKKDGKKEMGERPKKESKQEEEYLRKLEEEREREREREKDRMSVTREALERSYLEARQRVERAAIERATARERSSAEQEARLRAERAAVERATAEARQRAFEKAMVEKALQEPRDRMERSSSEKFSAHSRSTEMRQSSSPEQHEHQSTETSKLRYSYSSAHAGIEGESPQRCKARLERYRRTSERAAKALAEKNMRDLLAQREQAERNRLADNLDAEVKRWSSGKEGNLRALLSTLQYILGPTSGWQPIPLTEVITSAAVKKAYRKATLCVHPDKLQQRGATIQQKYICEKVFDLLKEAWNRFNSEER